MLTPGLVSDTPVFACMCLYSLAFHAGLNSEFDNDRLGLTLCLYIMITVPRRCRSWFLEFFESLISIFSALISANDRRDAMSL